MWCVCVCVRVHVCVCEGEGEGEGEGSGDDDDDDHHHHHHHHDDDNDDHTRWRQLCIVIRSKQVLQMVIIEHRPHNWCVFPAFSEQVARVVTKPELALGPSE